VIAAPSTFQFSQKNGQFALIYGETQVFMAEKVRVQKSLHRIAEPLALPKAPYGKSGAVYRSWLVYLTSVWMVG